MKLKTLILAAGKGTRMKSDLPKVLHKVNGVPMVKKIVSVLDSIGASENILILGHKKELILEEFNNTASYVVQEEQLGTGHAVMQAEDVLKDFDGTVLVTCGDTPLLTKESFLNLYENHANNNNIATVMTAKIDNPFGYGRIIKKDGNVIAIIEEKEADEEIKRIDEINVGVFCFNSKELFTALSKISNDNNQGEYYLTDVLKVLAKENKKIGSSLLEDNSEMLGVNSKVQLAMAAKTLRDRKNKELMDDGVILIDPANTYVEESAKIGYDTVIYPNSYIKGNTVIGNNCEILSSTTIVDSKIGNNVRIETSVVEESEIDENATIGPFAHLRPMAKLDKNVHVGNFVEIKKSHLHEGVKTGHLTYIGDTEIGANTNVGAGTITCNYDGKNKHKTIIGKDNFVGSNTIFVAPVETGDNVVTAAGSVITKFIPDRALSFARAKQVNKKEWNKK